MNKYKVINNKIYDCKNCQAATDHHLSYDQCCDCNDGSNLIPIKNNITFSENLYKLDRNGNVTIEQI